MIEKHALRKSLQEGVDPMQSGGFSEYSMLSRSFNNPAMITAIRQQFASVVKTAQEGLETDRTKVKPLKKQEIAGMLN